MAFFSPESLLKAMGFDPAEFMKTALYYKGEFDAMKAGLQQLAAHFNGQLATIHDAQARIESKLDALLAGEARAIAGDFSGDANKYPPEPPAHLLLEGNNHE